MTEHTEPTDATVAADEDGAKAQHTANEDPTPEEAAAADRSRDTVDDTVRSEYKELVERGAQQKGEGRIA